MYKEEKVKIKINLDKKLSVKEIGQRLTDVATTILNMGETYLEMDFAQINNKKYKIRFEIYEDENEVVR